MTRHQPQSRFVDCPACQWPVPKNPDGTAPFCCCACGEILAGNPDLPAKRPVAPGVDFEKIRQHLEKP